MKTSTYQSIVNQLADLGLKITFAESCTGGAITEKITECHGSSKIFDLGIVAYSNKMKTNILGVSEKTLKEHGAVSEETVFEMAKGALKLSNADISVAVSGIEGPGGGTLKKPVGLVYVCIIISSPILKKKILREFRFSGSRNDIRNSTVCSTFDLLNEFLSTI